MLHFNPRSLAGATLNIVFTPTLSLFQSTLPRGSDFDMYWPAFAFLGISIHAPSRERRSYGPFLIGGVILFQSTLPRGSDRARAWLRMCSRIISIHAPSRERPWVTLVLTCRSLFQSTLPRGSDNHCNASCCNRSYFNPRSLAGATGGAE